MLRQFRVSCHLALGFSIVMAACVAPAYGQAPASRGDGQTSKPVDVSEHLKRVHDALGKEEQTAKEKGFNYRSISDAELTVKVTRDVNDPMITSMSWGTTTPGGEIHYTVGVYNPGATAVPDLYVHVFVGPSNAIDDPGEALATIDARFPRLTQPPAFGFTLGPGDFQTFEFSIAVPSSIDRSAYLGNTFLFQLPGFRVGRYLDRSAFTFQVQ